MKRDEPLEGVGGGEGGLQERAEGGELLGDGCVLVDEDEDLGEFEAEEGCDGAVLR